MHVCRTIGEVFYQHKSPQPASVLWLAPRQTSDLECRVRRKLLRRTRLDDRADRYEPERERAASQDTELGCGLFKGDRRRRRKNRRNSSTYSTRSPTCFVATTGHSVPRLCSATSARVASVALFGTSVHFGPLWEEDIGTAGHERAALCGIARFAVAMSTTLPIASRCSSS